MLCATEPAFAAHFYVNTASDDVLTAGCIDGHDAAPADSTLHPCSLRGALSKLSGTPNEIDFDVAGPFAIATPLPDIPGGTDLNGCYPSTYGGPCETEFDGHGANFPGFVADGAGSHLDNLAVHGFTDGIELAGTGGHEVGGADVGVTPDGFSPVADPNTGDGLLIEGGSVGDEVNLSAFSGNGRWGIELQPGADNSSIDTSWIGTTPPPSTTAIPNGAGGMLVDSSNNAIGNGFTNPHCSDASPPPVCYPIYVSGNNGPGIVLGGDTTENLVANAFVGLNVDASVPVGNHGDGIVAGGTHQVLGGPNELSGDLISSNTGNGILLTGTDISVETNTIGSGEGGHPEFANGKDGVLVSNAGGSVGGDLIALNTIGDNLGSGVEVQQSGVSLSGNYIGVTQDGSAVPNLGAGVTVASGPTRIGGDATTANVIADNGGPGVAVSAPRTTIKANQIYGNGGLGIAYSQDPVSAPVLSAVSSAGGSETYHGSLQGAPNTAYTIDLYGQSACDQGGAGEGHTPAGTGSVTTDSTGKGFFGYSGAAAFTLGDVITATATDPSGTTSQFSTCATTVGPVDLNLTQSVVGAALTNGPVDVSIAVANHGLATATNVTVTETVPSGTTLDGLPSGCGAPLYGELHCLLAPLAPGAVEKLDFLLNSPHGGTLANLASVTSDEVESDTDDNANTLSFPVTTPGSGPYGPPPNITESGPVFASTVELDHVSGAITATLPNGKAITLRKFAIVPVGTVVHADRGIAAVTAALPGTKTTASGHFSDTSFAVGQTRQGRGLVSLTLVAPLRGCSAAADLAHAAAAMKAKPSRHLWGHAHGRFKTIGKYGTAEVHGTHWLVTDSCHSTTVRVVSGVVLVSPTNGARPAARLLYAGQSVVFRPVARHR